MGVETSADNILTMQKFKNADAAPHFHSGQCNLTRAHIRSQTSSADDNQVWAD